MRGASARAFRCAKFRATRRPVTRATKTSRNRFSGRSEPAPLIDVTQTAGGRVAGDCSRGATGVMGRDRTYPVRSPCQPCPGRSRATPTGTCVSTPSVTEVTGRTAHCAGMRVFVRREHPHPGAHRRINAPFMTVADATRLGAGSTTDQRRGHARAHRMRVHFYRLLMRSRTREPWNLLPVRAVAECQSTLQPSLTSVAVALALPDQPHSSRQDEAVAVSAAGWAVHGLCGPRDSSAWR